MAKYRRRMSRRSSRRSFTRNALRTNKRNFSNPMRGGIRL